MTQINKLAEIHGSKFARGRCFGKQAAFSNLEEDSLLPFVLTAGAAGAWGGEIVIHDGTVLEAGNPEKRFHAGRWVITDATAADKAIYIVSFHLGLTTFAASTRGTAFTYVTPSDKSNPQAIYGIGGAFSCAMKIWARCRCSDGAKDISIMFEGEVLNP